MMGRIIGVDVGGSHITTAAIEKESYQLVAGSLARAEVNAGGSIKNIINEWKNCILRTKGDEEIEQICLAMPGPFDYENGISLMQGQMKYEQLYGCDVRLLLAKELKISPDQVFFANDAACFLHGEVIAGAALKHQDDAVAGLTLGTGLGSAFYNGRDACSKDLWSLPFKNGMAEDFLSSRWFVSRYHRLTSKKISGVKELNTVGERNAAKMLFAEFGSNLGEFITLFLKKDPATAVVIGGNIAKAYDQFKDEMLASVHQQFPDVSVYLSSNGENAALVGAVGSWLAKPASVLNG